MDVAQLGSKSLFRAQKVTFVLEFIKYLYYAWLNLEELWRNMVFCLTSIHFKRVKFEVVSWLELFVALSY